MPKWDLLRGSGDLLSMQIVCWPIAGKKTVGPRILEKINYGLSNILARVTAVIGQAHI
jgi:hypothetical protein